MFRRVAAPTLAPLLASAQDAFQLPPGDPLRRPVAGRRRDGPRRRAPRAFRPLGGGAEGRRPPARHRRPNSTAVSLMRFEKPHSLSYHAITRTSAPSTTCVCVASKVEDIGLWLKSMETSGSVL